VRGRTSGSIECMRETASNRKQPQILIRVAILSVVSGENIIPVKSSHSSFLFSLSFMPLSWWGGGGNVFCVGCLLVRQHPPTTHQLAGTLAHVDLSLLAADVGEAAAATLDSREGIHDLRFVSSSRKEVGFAIVFPIDCGPCESPQCSCSSHEECAGSCPAAEEPCISEETPRHVGDGVAYAHG
jgi:hypothetical protein